MPIDRLRVAEMADVMRTVTRHHQMLIARRNVSVTSKDSIAVPGLGDLQSRDAVQAFGKVLAEGLRNVLGDDHARRIRRKFRQQRGNRSVQGALTNIAHPETKTLRVDGRPG
ncbi:MAG: hypothetical protein VB948_02645 [Pseudomonadales bacterium]